MEIILFCLGLLMLDKWIKELKSRRQKRKEQLKRIEKYLELKERVHKV